MTLTFLSENASGGPAALSDLQAWANMSGQEGLVVYNDAADMWYPFADNGSIALPSTIFIGPGMKIAKMGHPEPFEIELVLPGL